MDLEEFKNKTFYEVVDGIDGIYVCTDGFLIVDCWETIGVLINNWAHNILPAPGYEELDDLLEGCAWNDHVIECQSLGLTADKHSYNWKRYLERYWSRHGLQRVGEALEDSEKCGDLPYQFTVDEYLSTYPLEDRQWGFGDEYSSCSNCCSSIRTAPDCYDWTLQAQATDDGYLCPECIDVEEYLEAKKNAADNCDRGLVDPSKYGWTQLLDDDAMPHRFESGMYGGQTDDPKKQLAVLNAAGIDVLFTLYPRQFDIAWELWVPTGKEEQAWQVLENADVKADVDPSAVMRQQLENTSVACRQRKEDECCPSSDGETVNIPQLWMRRHPGCRMDPQYWIEFKRRHDAMPQPVSDDDWFKLAETLDAEMRG